MVQMVRVLGQTTRGVGLSPTWHYPFPCFGLFVRIYINVLTQTIFVIKWWGITNWNQTEKYQIYHESKNQAIHTITGKNIPQHIMKNHNKALWTKMKQNAISWSWNLYGCKILRLKHKCFRSKIDINLAKENKYGYLKNILDGIQIIDVYI